MPRSKIFAPTSPMAATGTVARYGAHANCLENLPLYTAIVVAIVAAGIRGSALDTLAMIFLVARICQTVAHITLAPTNLAASIRFIFFSIQIVCMLWMGLIVALSV